MAMLDRVAADHGAALTLHVGRMQLGWFSPTEAAAVGAVGAALFALITVAIALGYDMVWFGVLVVTVAEIGLIMLPVGLGPPLSPQFDARGPRGARGRRPS